MVAAALITYFLLAGEKQPPSTGETKKDPPLEEQFPNLKNLEGNEEMLKNAFNLYFQKKDAGVDFTNGPCLGHADEDWVVDIAHEPRQPADDQKENQCEDYLSGKAKHFVEFSPEGKILRTE